jgi:hypothetical protein
VSCARQIAPAGTIAPVADREALFYFAGGGLFVTGGALGGTAEFHWAGRRATVALPCEDHVSDAGRWGREARKTSWREDDDGKVVEITTATVTTFEVRVEVPDKIDDREAVRDAFPVALQIAETLLATARTLGGQYWIPAAHEAPELNGYGSLVAPGTYDELDEQARWHPPISPVAHGEQSAIDARGTQYTPRFRLYGLARVGARFRGDPHRRHRPRELVRADLPGPRREGRRSV